MSDTTSIPPRLTTLGQALRPCLELLQRRLDEAAYPDTGIDELGTWLQTSVNRLGEHLASLNTQFAQLSSEVLANENVRDADIYRSAGRFEAYLHGFLDDRTRIRRALVPADFIAARDLLAGAYRHNLSEINAWLARFIAMLDDPLAEARRQGLPEDGAINLDSTLSLTTAPEMAELSAWVERQRKKNDKHGFWALLGGIALGAMFLDGVIDNDCGDCGTDT